MTMTMMSRTNTTTKIIAKIAHSTGGITTLWVSASKNRKLATVPATMTTMAQIAPGIAIASCTLLMVVKNATGSVANTITTI
jgi:3-polyprenyl-4-hydroxybenzoate decarboxylase